MKRMILKLLAELGFPLILIISFLLMIFLTILGKFVPVIGPLHSLIPLSLIPVYLIVGRRYGRLPLRTVGMKTDIGTLYAVVNSEFNEIVDTTIDNPFFEWVRRTKKQPFVSWIFIKDSFELSFSFKTLRKGEEMEISATLKIKRDKDFEASLDLAEKLSDEGSKYWDDLREKVVRKFEKAYLEAPEDLNFSKLRLQEAGLNLDDLPFFIDLSSVEFDTESVVLYPTKEPQ